MKPRRHAGKRPYNIVVRANRRERAALRAAANKDLVTVSDVVRAALKTCGVLP